MYCPQCAAELGATAAHCPGCGLDVRPIARLLREPREGIGNAARRWQPQRHALGLLLVLCSLLVGCFIPISIGLLNGVVAVGPLVLVLGGLAGVLLVLGAMLILASEGAILTSARAEQPPAHTLLPDTSLGEAGVPYEGELRQPARR
ncbi:MAG TPA: hypothetical protein PLO33_01600 [Kouleothrix sp.]|uniref:hypothetical protein n=1 Tax=Kouleothrix sp. TaxID=2779161 RepID=UPI002B52FC06|nr:hypothetical protein [Kouleothrix sp.]HRC74339.1 hypothetical protein [Kouleothrix sp.]